MARAMDPFCHSTRAWKGERMANSSDATGEIRRRLDLLIFLQLDDKYPSPTDKIAKLDEAGLNSSEIGGIVGKKANYVTATLSQRNKRLKKK